MIEHGQHRQIESLSEADLERFNAEFDNRCSRQPGHELGVPGFARLRAELADEDLAELVWAWHRREQNQ